MDTILVATLIFLVAALTLAVFLFLRRRSSRTFEASSRDGKSIESLTAAPTDDLTTRVGASRGAISSALASLFAADHLTSTDWRHLEDTLIAADVGPSTASTIVESVLRAKPASAQDARTLLKRELLAALTRTDRSLSLVGSPAVMIVVGVNGTGKTTSIAKIAKLLVDSGMSVVLGAADTFRAAADTQLRSWGDRVGALVVAGSRGADPASVAFDAYVLAKESEADVVIIDTAGRLHSQANLMEELTKIVRVLEREAGNIDEVLLVLDGTTGQNGLSQAEAFAEAIGVTGLVLTKLDGTSRGGIVISVERDLETPVKFVGVGEGLGDLLPFDPEEFVDALIAR